MSGRELRKLWRWAKPELIPEKKRAADIDKPTISITQIADLYWFWELIFANKQGITSICSQQLILLERGWGIFLLVWLLSDSLRRHFLLHELATNTFGIFYVSCTRAAWHNTFGTFVRVCEMCRAFTLASFPQWPNRSIPHRLGLLLYPFAKLADATNWCWWKIRTHGIKEDLERIQKELEKDEFSQSLCPICLEPLESQNGKK